MKVATFFISRTKQNYKTFLTASESTLKINIIIVWTPFEILVTSAVICKQKLLHKKEIVLYDWDHYDLNP